MGLSPSLRRFCPCDYIDSLALRYYDSDTDANLAEGSDGEYYYSHDANYNVTSVLNSSGSPPFYMDWFPLPCGTKRARATQVARAQVR
jgi:hypothetical protein